MVLLEGGWLMVFGWPHAWCLSSLKFGKVNAKTSSDCWRVFVVMGESAGLKWLIATWLELVEKCLGSLQFGCALVLVG